jgi:twitching motility protein PilT
MSLPESSGGPDGRVPSDEDYNIDDLLSDIMDMESSDEGTSHSPARSGTAVQESHAAREPAVREAPAREMPVQEGRAPAVPPAESGAPKPQVAESAFDDLDDLTRELESTAKPMAKAKSAYDDIEDLADAAESTAKPVAHKKPAYDDIEDLTDAPQSTARPAAKPKPVYDDIEDFTDEPEITAGPHPKAKPVYDDIEDVDEDAPSTINAILMNDATQSIMTTAMMLKETASIAAARPAIRDEAPSHAAAILEADDEEEEEFKSLEDLLDGDEEPHEKATYGAGEGATIEFGEGNTIPFKADYTIPDLLTFIFETNASDLHFSAGAPPVVRLHGDLLPLDVPRLDNAHASKLLMAILDQKQREKFLSTKRIDFTYELGKTARFRTNIFYQYHGIAAAFRLIPHTIPTIDYLGLPQILKEVALSRSGMVIVTGPTGSGKSTTLASMIDFINENRSAHIITVEDPIEFFHTNKNCLIDHREVGEHANNFADAVRSALREDPDIILVGEMRDLETIYQAVKVAETGCLVYATLHTNNASKAVDRMIDVFPAKQQAQIRSMLAQSLRAVIAQQLIKKIGGKGRVAVLEILLAISGLGNLIREGKTSQIPNFINTGRTYGMQSIDLALMELVKQEVITLEAAKEKCQDPSNFEETPIAAT